MLHAVREIFKVTRNKLDLRRIHVKKWHIYELLVWKRHYWLSETTVKQRVQLGRTALLRFNVDKYGGRSTNLARTWFDIFWDIRNIANVSREVVSKRCEGSECRRTKNASKSSLSILVNNQLDAQFFFRIYLFQFSTCFEHPCSHHQENRINTTSAICHSM
jgi:hypothetical protein